MIKFPSFKPITAHKRSINQFLMVATLVVSLHYGTFLVQPELLGSPFSYLPMLIDGVLILSALFFLILARLALARMPHSATSFLLDIPGTLIFLTLGASALAVVVYSAYTGDSLNLAIIGYSVLHIDELFDPIVAESGYFSLFVAASLTTIACIVLYRAHVLDTKRLVFTLLLFPNTLLVLSPFTASSHPARFLSFFTPASNEYQADFELDKEPLPPWYRSFYMTMFGWGHGSFKSLEHTEPKKQYKPATYIGQTGNRPNVVLITLESVRADVISPYTDVPEIKRLTPNMDELSKSGLTFERVYTTVPHTSKALVGIFCGYFPNQEMEITEAEPNGLPAPCLPRFMEKAGYKTSFFQSAIGKFENRHGLTNNMGFQEVYSMEQLPQKDFKRISYVAMDDYVMMDPSIDWMRKQKKKNQPFFLGMLNVVTHHPYLTPESKTAREARTNSSIKKLPFDNYLDTIAYTDKFIGDLIGKMRQEGLLDNTLVIITGDHGEAFGDHGPSFHNGTPHEDGMGVPLLIYSPSLFPDTKRIGGLRSQMDILPTVLDVTGIKVRGELPGKSLLDQDGHDSLSGACWYENHCAVHYKANGEKYIYWYGRKPNEFYKLHEDPKESRNLIHSLSPHKEREFVRSTYSELNSLQTVYTDKTLKYAEHSN